MAAKSLKKISSNRIEMFKIRNRRGFAAVCMNHLTEGRSPAEAFDRISKALKRAGFLITGSTPRPR